MSSYTTILKYFQGIMYSYESLNNWNKLYLIYILKYIHIKTIMYEKKIAFKKSNILVESVKNYPDCIETWDINFWYPTHDLGSCVKGGKIGWIV
jgi:hypothetical protein